MAETEIHTDIELVQLLKQSSSAAFNSIYQRHWPVLYNSAYKRLCSKEQTEDVLQDVFIRLWFRRHEIEISNLAAYLATAVRYEVIKYIAKNKTSDHFYQPFEELLFENDTPEGKMIAKEFIELVSHYADTLPEKRKQIFLLHIQSKLGTKEIAKHLCISQKTVQNQLGTALNGLRNNLAPVILALIASHN